MNGSELYGLLKSAEYDFEGRFDETWALDWMRENWWVPKGGRCCKRGKSQNLSREPGESLGPVGTINAAYYVTAVVWE